MPCCPSLNTQFLAPLPHLATGYDEEARYFEAGVSEAKREELVEALEGLVRPAFEGQLALLRELALAAFKQQLAMGGAPGEAFVDRAQR